MALKVLHIKRVYAPYASCGDALAKVLRIDYPEAHVIAVIPRMFAFFATAPERHEVTEIEVILEVV